MYAAAKPRSWASSVPAVHAILPERRSLCQLKYAASFHIFDLHFARHCREGRLPSRHRPARPQSSRTPGRSTGFLSSDCDLDADCSGYTDKVTGIVYISDSSNVDAGDGIYAN